MHLRSALAAITASLIVVGALLLVTGGSEDGPTVTRIEGLACGRALLGTGFVVDDVVVTNAHVVAGASELAIVDTAGISRPAVVTGFDADADLAALKVMGAQVDSSPVRFADADEGDSGSVAGSAFEVKRRIRATIGDIYGDGEVVRPSLELATEIVDGDSGAPLIDPDGAVVGVIYANSRGKPATAYAIRAPEVEDFLAELSDTPVEPGDCR